MLNQLYNKAIYIVSLLILTFGIFIGIYSIINKKNMLVAALKPFVNLPVATNVSFSLSPKTNTTFFKVDINPGEFSMNNTYVELLIPSQTTDYGIGIKVLYGASVIVNLLFNNIQGTRSKKIIDIKNMKSMQFTFAFVIEKEMMLFYVNGIEKGKIQLPTGFQKKSCRQTFSNKFIVTNFMQFLEALSESQISELHEKYIKIIA